MSYELKKLSPDDLAQASGTKMNFAGCEPGYSFDVPIADATAQTVYSAARYWSQKLGRKFIARKVGDVTRIIATDEPVTKKPGRREGKEPAPNIPPSLPPLSPIQEAGLAYSAYVRECRHDGTKPLDPETWMNLRIIACRQCSMYHPAFISCKAT